MIPTVLAHGALGPYDEVIFIGVAAVFIVMMGISWVKSRNTMPDFEDEAQPRPDTPDAPAQPDRFRLE